MEGIGDNNCLFCRIAKGEIPAYLLHQDEHAMAFLDINPLAPGHTVVIPRAHAATLIDLAEPEVGPLFIALREVTRRVLLAVQAEGATIGINQGEVAGQTIPHLHIHIFPRFSGDGGGSVHSVVNNPPRENLVQMVEKIKSIK
mgnify:CR=1 FL=1